MHNFQIQYKVGNDKNWKSVALGIGYVIAIKEDNTLWGWGLNDKGVLGDGTTTSQVDPIQIINCTDMSTDHFNIKEIIFYPNPVQNVLHWTDNLDFRTYEIRNHLGQKIKFGNTDKRQSTFQDLIKAFIL